MTDRIAIVKRGTDDFGREMFFYADGSVIQCDTVNGMWRLYDAKYKNIDNDRYRVTLQQRNNLERD